MNLKNNKQLEKKHKMVKKNHETTKDSFINNIYNILLCKHSMVIIYVHSFIHE